MPLTSWMVVLMSVDDQETGFAECGWTAPKHASRVAWGLSQVRTPLAAKSRSQLPARQQPCTIFGTRLVEGYWGNEEIDMKAKEDESGKGMMQRVGEGLEEEEF